MSYLHRLFKYFGVIFGDCMIYTLISSIMLLGFACVNCVGKFQSNKPKEFKQKNDLEALWIEKAS